MSFKLKHYQKTIEKYLADGYIFSGVNSKQYFEKQVAMVHDVDHRVEYSLNFSKIEKEVGVKSSYFLRLHAKNYNMLSYSSLKVAESILEDGHDLGLHYEAGYCSDKNYENHIKKELDTLSNFLGTEIRTFNIHEPARTGVDIGSLLPEFNRCYNSTFFRDFKYLSDSGCRWREGCFSEHVGKWKKILVLTHPFWWYNETPSENY